MSNVRAGFRIDMLSWRILRPFFPMSLRNKVCTFTGITAYVTNRYSNLPSRTSPCSAPACISFVCFLRARIYLVSRKEARLISNCLYTRVMRGYALIYISEIRICGYICGFHALAILQCILNTHTRTFFVWVLNVRLSKRIDAVSHSENPPCASPE